MRNGGAPPLALKGGKFKDKADREEYRRQMKEIHGGPQNAGEWLLLPPDSEVQMLGFSLQDSQFIESQQFDIEEIARWYGVPPHLVGHLLRATFNNIEELGISFVKYSLIMWLKLWEQEVWRKLLTPAEQLTHYAKFNVDALERGNMQTRTEAGVKNFFNGHWTLNEWAERDDMNPVTETVMIDGESVNLGDIRFVQQAMIPLSAAAKGPVQPAANVPNPPQEEPPASEQSPPKATADDNGLSAAITGLQQQLATITTSQQQIVDATVAGLRATQKQLAAAMLRDVMSRMVSLEVNAVKRVAEKPSRFDARLREFYGKHKLTMLRSLSGPFSAYYASGNETFQVDADAYTERHIAESLRQLDALTDCTAEELESKVGECVDRWHEERITTGELKCN